MKHLTKPRLNVKTVLSLTFLSIIFLVSCQKNKDSKPTPNIPNVASSFASDTTSGNTDSIGKGLIAYWAFSGVAYDFSGNGNNGVGHFMSTTTDRSGHAGGAYSFNGSTSYVDVKDTAALRLANTDFTINAWVYLNDYNPGFGSVVVTKRISGVADEGYTLSIGGYESSSTPDLGILHFGPGGGSENNALGKKVISTGQWHMLTAKYTLSAHSLRLFIDGVLDDVTNNIASPNAVNSARLFIGRDDPDDITENGYFLNGAMSDIRIYKRAITSAEIHHLLITPTAPTQGLIAYWPLTNTPKDLSGNSFDGKLTNVKPTTDRFGNPVGAYNFNGINSCITIKDNPSLRLNNTDFTINSWINIASYSNSFGSSILDKRTTGADDGWVVSIVGETGSPLGAVAFGPGGGSTNAIGTRNIPLNNWYMVTTTYTLASKTLRIYVNGVLDNTTRQVSSPNALIDAQLYIGCDNPTIAGANDYFFHGALNDIRIYNRVLTKAEITDLHTALN